MNTEKEIASLYETEAINEDGVNGVSYVNSKEGMRVVVSSPLSDVAGSNPEELLGLSLSTCFNSTIKAILKESGNTNKSKVVVPVKLKEEPSDIGYYFEVEVLASIEGMSFEAAALIVESASKRCPVFKLLKESHSVHLNTVPYEDN